MKSPTGSRSQLPQPFNQPTNPMNIQTPAYPFYTRYGSLSYKAYISDDVLLRVIKPDLYSNQAEIDWTRTRHSSEQPDFTDRGGYCDVLIDRAEFMAAYVSTETFMQAAAREFLPVVPVRYLTHAQGAEISCLLNHPAFSRAEKTKWLLRLNRLTYSDASVAIQVLNDARHLFDQPGRTVGEYAVVGEAFEVKAA